MKTKRRLKNDYAKKQLTKKLNKIHLEKINALCAKIITPSHPDYHILSEPCPDYDDVENNTSKITQDIDEMIDVLNATKTGVGLAASQIGIQKNAIVWRESTKTQKFNYMINPRIRWMSDETETRKEACLSYPGVLANVERSVSCEVEWVDAKNEYHKKHFHGWAARILQHELDHTLGICKVGDEYERNNSL